MWNTLLWPHLPILSSLLTLLQLLFFQILSRLPSWAFTLAWKAFSSDTYWECSLPSLLNHRFTLESLPEIPIKKKKKTIPAGLCTFYSFVSLFSNNDTMLIFININIFVFLCFFLCGHLKCKLHESRDLFCLVLWHHRLEKYLEPRNHVVNIVA